MSNRFGRGISGLSLALAAGLVAPLQAATWYVSPSGNDTTGSGSQASPYRQIRKALTVVHAGDTVQVEIEKIGVLSNPIADETRQRPREQRE